MGSHRPFRHLQHKLCAKEGLGVKLTIWLLTTKSRESTRPRCVQGECNTPLESYGGEVQVCFRRRPDRRSEQRVMTLWSPGSPNKDNFETISGLHLGSLGTKAIWMWVRRSNAENTIWGKVVASLEFGPWWVKWVCVARGLSQHLGWFRRCTNQFVGWFLMHDRVTK
jgi:hypothetical protein